MAAKKDGKDENGPGSPFASLTASPSFRNFVVFFTMLLVCCAVLVIVLFVLQKKSTMKLFEAVEDIRSIVEIKHGTTQGLTDPQILSEAKLLTDGFSKWNEERNKVGSKVEEISQLKKKGWEGALGYLYLFTTQKSKITVARAACSDYKSTLAQISDHVQEIFLEEEVKKKNVDHWIGLRYFLTERDWVWPDSSNLTRSIMFWNTEKGMPQPFNNKKQDEQNSCVAIVAKCSPQKCWEQIICGTELNFICMMNPEKIFFP